MQEDEIHCVWMKTFLIVDKKSGFREVDEINFEKSRGKAKRKRKYIKKEHTKKAYIYEAS